MSTSSKGDDAGRRGFTLVEALVALVVAGLLLPALARAMGAAWTTDRAPFELVTGVALAGDVAAGAAVPPAARARGFSAERNIVPARLLVLPSELAPAPRAAGRAASSGRAGPGSPPTSGDPAAAQGASPPDAAAALVLSRVSVEVRTPSGRRVVIDQLRLDDAPR